MKHPLGPLKYVATAGGRSIKIQALSGEILGELGGYGATPEENEEWAARLVKCWNAMVDIDDPAAARALLDDPRAQLATDLIEGLREAISQIEADYDCTPLDGRGVLIRKLEELLRRAEGYE